MRPLWSFLATASALIPAVVQPATIRVPADQPTIAAALAVAAPGDEVVLSCGTYLESGLTMRPGVTLRSETGFPDCATIEGRNAAGRVLMLTGTDYARVEGLTITGSRGGVRITNALNAQFVRCDFLRNRFPPEGFFFGAAMLATGSEVSIGECRFIENSGPRASAIYSEQTKIEISRSEFLYNHHTGAYGYAALTLSSPSVIQSSRFTENDRPLEVRGGRIEDCTFERNRGVTGRDSDSYTFGFADVSILRCVFDSNGCSNLVVGSNQLTFGSSSPSLIQSCLFRGGGCPGGALILASPGTEVAVRQTIFTDFSAATVFYCGKIAVDCSSFWNVPSLFPAGCAADTTGLVFEDPLFCDPSGANFSLSASSSCLPGRSPCGELIGPFGVGCGPVTVVGESWGRIKSYFR